MTAYYNEHDRAAAAWLRELIKQNLIAPGVVDERSIADVRPSDLRGFSQCHFFAGIGVWSYALRLAGVPDTRRVWTGSCPCQPFSNAGAGAGFADERHLWPHLHWLIKQCRPELFFGEQVASQDGLSWFDLVQSDLEGTGYAVGKADLCASGWGAPHIRQRLYFVGHSIGARLEGYPRHVAGPDPRGPASSRQIGPATQAGVYLRLADHQLRQQPVSVAELLDTESDAESRGGVVGMADDHLPSAARYRLDGGPSQTEKRIRYGSADCSEPVGMADLHCFIGDEGSGSEPGSDHRTQQEIRPGPTNGFWRDADWLFCRDAKWRPVEPGTFPLADGTAERVVLLRGYGNAICAPVAQGFIEASIEAINETQGV